MNANVSLVDYAEHVSIKAGEFLLAKGFDLATSSGIAGAPLKVTDSLGILQKIPGAVPKEYFFGLITVQPRRKFLGTIWFKDSLRNATEGDWIFELHGRENLAQVQELAGGMASTFNVKIRLHLTCEHSRTEAVRSILGD
ncbi:hypothetical protein A3C87_03105 [Candidatus Kaiserbacteria bacterium RIFCSPHIGHO2_02_FULL_49_34]|uniref:Uncharacterized protein n=1 Tax=Candidatus Kaiserbacteria bacterium RIFCSPHIGHO2_02_FULL_49_34 TaxID=1798491 RepID=A0A1F6DI73_9BACT|nr:MAG: hypothetical protein A3C87_03105 [Candidatus Kaiserbacteria bacterium RIFCSPHIGHO2_02_FULL_49_34]